MQKSKGSGIIEINFASIQLLFFEKNQNKAREYSILIWNLERIKKQSWGQPCMQC